MERELTAHEEALVAAGVDKLLARFAACQHLRDHLAIVDEPETRRRLEWLQANRRELWRARVYPAINASWNRLYTEAKAAPAIAQPSVVAEVVRRSPAAVEGAVKTATTRAYEARRCFVDGCENRASFGFGPPLVTQPFWSCRAHREQAIAAIKAAAV